MTVHRPGSKIQAHGIEMTIVSVQIKSNHVSYECTWNNDGSIHSRWIDEVETDKAGNDGLSIGFE